MTQETVVFDGTAIKSARIKAQMSQQELAHRVSVTQQAISKFERNLSEPSATVLLRLQRALLLPSQQLEGQR